MSVTEGKVPSGYCLDVGSHMNDTYKPCSLLLARDFSEASRHALNVASPDQLISESTQELSVRDRLTEVLREPFFVHCVRIEYHVGDPPAKILSKIVRQHKTELLLIRMHLGKSLSDHMPPTTGFYVVLSAPCPVPSVCV